MTITRRQTFAALLAPLLWPLRGLLPKQNESLVFEDPTAAKASICGRRTVVTNLDDQGCRTLTVPVVGRTGLGVVEFSPKEVDSALHGFPSNWVLMDGVDVRLAGDGVTVWVEYIAA